MSTTNQAAIEAEGLVKRVGSTTALDGVDLTVPTGTGIGVLGPNSAGKTTAVRILGTLLRPDAGHAIVGGYAQIVAETAGVRPSVDVVNALVSAPVSDGSAMPLVVRRLDEAGIAVTELSLRLPSLDEVFLALTGHTTTDEPAVLEGATR